MEIGCTKKLLDAMSISPIKDTVEKDMLFSWSAHIIAINRRKTVVVVNNSNRSGFALHGLKAKDFKNLGHHIIDGIRSTFKNEGYKDEIIERYLADAGTIVFTKTKGPKYVARMNKACDELWFCADSLKTTELYQLETTKCMNNALVKVINNDYEYVYELLLHDLSRMYGESLIKVQAADILVKLDLGSYTCARRIITPLDISFKKLHKVLQIAFGWKDYHLYEFKIIDNKGKLIAIILSEQEEEMGIDYGCPVLRDSDLSVRDYLNKQNKIMYNYDYGDYWEHEIQLREIMNEYDKNYPLCTTGAGNAPPEDVGGVHGYEEFREIMANPEHPEYQDTKLWADSQFYKELNIEWINHRLKNSLR